MTRVQSITFMFKDCESIEVPEKYIGLISINDIQKNIGRITLGNVQEHLVCNEFFIEIFKEFDGEYDSLYNINKFERFVKSRDIVTLYIKYDDGTSEYINVLYTGEKDNLYQYTWASRLGNLYLCVSPRKCLEDFILEKDANNAVQVNLRKSFALRQEIKKCEMKDEEAEEWLL